MEKDSHLDAICIQAEYYMTDENLKQDEFFYNLIEQSKNVHNILN